MPTFVTRRTALGVVAAAALASLTACQRYPPAGGPERS